MKLKYLPPVRPPNDFAAQTASQIALAVRLEYAGNLHPPPDFAFRLATKIAAEAEGNPLAGLAPIQPPQHFAANLAVQIAKDANPLETLSPISAPPDFAFRLANRISQSQTIAFEPVKTPAQFAARVASRIAEDAGNHIANDAALGSEPDRTPLYFLGLLLSGVALAFGALTWRDAQAAGVALFEVLRSLPESLLFPVGLLAIFAVVATLAKRVARLPAGLAAFVVAAAFVMPQVAGWFGSTRVEGSGQLTSVVRFAGDITVAAEVRGDVIAIGGNVRLEPGARVSGRVLTFLGDVSVPEGASANAVSAVLGNFSGTTREKNQRSYSLPGLSAANALRPLQMLLTTNTWQWWYLGLLAALGMALVLLPKLEQPLQQIWRLEAGRSLGLGLLLVFFTIPIVALGGLSVLGTPFALVIGIFTVLAFSSGAALSLLGFGQGLGLRGVWAMLPGLVLFSAAMFFPAIALTLWLLLGAWGAGTLLIGLRQGVFVRV